jgi:YD repeat-containing protein
MHKLLVVAAIACLLITACRKLDNQLPSSPCNCKLLSIHDSTSEFNEDFTYDAYGRLATRHVSEQNHTSPDFKLIYDNNGRLVQYITSDNGGDYSIGAGFIAWHYLYYDALGRIVTDTLFGGGDLATIGADGPVWTYPEMPPNYTRSTITYTYDSQNRIVNANGESYTYNADGNLATDFAGDPVQYDNKVNFLSTNPVLQFMYRDYSKNNPVGAIAYNRYGLPLQYERSLHQPWTLVLDKLSFYTPKFTYSCK